MRVRTPSAAELAHRLVVCTEVLEHINKSDRCLVAGQPLWGDYTVEARVRQLNAFTQPSSDDPHAIVARSGLLLRYQDLGPQ